jgi:tRNA (cytidine/uridine-2'-O-)-methyltransferase
MNTGFGLHLIHPLGFELDDKRARRAGLDYHELARMKDYPTLQDYLDAQKPLRIFAISTKGQRPYHDVAFQPGDALYFGPETRGLPAHILEALPPTHRLRIPMRPDSRSLNLSNAVAVVVYEAWRQLQFLGAK